MRFAVIIEPPAERDIRQTVTWWSEHRSTEQGKRWYERIYPQLPHRLSSQIVVQSPRKQISLSQGCVRCTLESDDVQRTGSYSQLLDVKCISSVSGTPHNEV